MSEERIDLPEHDKSQPLNEEDLEGIAGGTAEQDGKSGKEQAKK